MGMLEKAGVHFSRPFSTADARLLLFRSYRALTNDSSVFGSLREFSLAERLGLSGRIVAEEVKADRQMRFRKAAAESLTTAAETYNQAVADGWGRLRETFQDMFRSVDKLYEAIIKTSGKDAKGFEDVRLLLNSLSSVNLEDKMRYIRDFLKPMEDAVMDVMKKTGCTHADVVRYVFLKHGLERNEVLAKRDYDKAIDEAARYGPVRTRPWTISGRRTTVV